MPVINVQVVQNDFSSSTGKAREHALTMDRPEPKGGQNKGPMGGEALLMGLGGCFMSNLLAAALARNIGLSAVTLDIAAELADAPPRYTAIKMSVRAKCDQRDELPKLVTIAERGCIVANTLRKALDLAVAVVD